MFKNFVFLVLMAMAGAFAQDLEIRKDTVVVIASASTHEAVSMAICDTVAAELDSIGRFVVLGPTEFYHLGKTRVFDAGRLRSPVDLKTFGKHILVSHFLFVRVKVSEISPAAASLYIELEIVDPVSAQALRSTNYSISSVSDKDNALTIAIGLARESIRSMLQKLYPLEAKVLSVEGRTLVLSNGANFGIKEGMSFFLYSPTSRKVLGEGIDAHGRHSAGLALANKVQPTKTIAEILYSTEPILSGYSAREDASGLMGAMAGVYFNPATATLIPILYFFGNPYHPNSGSLFIGYGILEDNRDKTTQLLRFGHAWDQKIVRRDLVSFGFREEIALLRIGQSKDDSSRAIDPLWKIQLSVGSIFHVKPSHRWHFLVGMHYTYSWGGNLVDKWKSKRKVPALNSDGDPVMKTIKRPAYWDPADGRRKVDLGGLFYSGGLTFIF